MQLNRVWLWCAGVFILLGIFALILWPTDASVPPAMADKAGGKPVQYSFRLGYNMPEGSVMHSAAMRLAEEVALKSDGRLKIELYPGQALGNDHQMLEMARSGELDMVLTPTAKLSISLPEMQYADLPFYFPSQADVYALLDGEPGQILLQRMARIGLVGVTFWGNGFKQFTANEALLEPEQFAGKRFRVMKSRLLQEQFEMLDAEAVPIDFHQVRAALRDAVVDGQENPLAAIVAMGIHQEQSHLILSSHAYLAYVLSVSEPSFSRLPASLQRLLIDSAREQTSWQRAETERREEGLLQQIADSGVRIERLSEAQRQRFSERLRLLVERFEPVIGADLIALSDEYLMSRYASDKASLIGIELDLTLASGEVGVDIKRGAELALKPISELGVIAMDNGGQPSRARRNMQRLVENPRVLATLGGTSVATMREQLRVIDEAQMPVLLPWVVSADLFDNSPHPSLFSIGVSSDHLADRVAAIAAEKELNRVGLITENSLAGTELAEQLDRALAEKGTAFGDRIKLNLGSPDIDDLQLRALIETSDYLVVALSRLEQGAVLRQLALAEGQREILSLWDMPPPDGVQPECLYTKMDKAAYAALALHYREHYGVAPKVPPALARGYDSALLLSASVQQLKAKGLALNRANLIRQLEDLPPVDGVIRRYERAYAPGQHRALSVDNYAASQQACLAQGGVAQ
ncbi:DctP family TRAP transporter solute-binding subunit [Marinobacterium sp. YM272]|uniref:DctP family TRAP transporter solute-binding subunit n=1 Tax=Marinobacterium sp. YM272 TaxID=3421654 RepID=UPI003D7FA440